MRPRDQLIQIRTVQMMGFDGGSWVLLSPLDDKQLLVIASWGMGWDHVSVSKRARTPCWREMEFVKRKFFLPDEAAMQLHVPPADHININPHCLHIWRPQLEKIPLPPMVLV